MMNWFLIPNLINSFFNVIRIFPDTLKTLYDEKKQADFNIFFTDNENSWNIQYIFSTTGFITLSDIIKFI